MGGKSSIKQYAVLIAALAMAHLAALSYILLNLTQQEIVVDEYETSGQMVQMSSLPTSLPLQDPKQLQEDHFTISAIRLKGKRNSKKEINRLSPPILAKSDAVLQIDEETVVLVGGFTDNYQNVSSYLQFFDIASQTWTARKKLPETVAETHQGIAFDKQRRILYIVSGQKGSGCMPATSVGVRYWIDENRMEFLPPLPAPRYSPGVEIALDPSNRNVSYLHVFGGADVNRKFGATDHWRLIFDDSKHAFVHTSNLAWEILESLPDAGVHGASFITSAGYLHYTAYCQMDQGVVESPNMADCHRRAVEDGQLLHHVSDVGLTFRYPAFVDPHHAHWERVTDMPFPTCHGGSFLDDASDTFYYFGGGLTNTQIKEGSAPKSLSMIHIFDANSMEWRVLPFDDAPRGSYLFSLMTWMDRGRRILYSLHPGMTIVEANISRTNVSMKRHISSSHLSQLSRSYLERTRDVAILAFKTCLRRQLNVTSPEIHCVTDDASSIYEYHQVRGTWNERPRALQYPDVVAFPMNDAHVSAIIKCARQTGYRLCSRNGKHSYDGSSSCSRGIVVDLSRMNAWGIVESKNSTQVRLAAGMTLGMVAVALESIGLALPSGSCASVGVTGLTLSGGQGPLSRLYGMTCDHLTAIDLVDSEGRLLHAADNNEFSDYLWLARGGGTVGHHFPGIITNLYFDKLVPIVPPMGNLNFSEEEHDSTVWTRARIRFPSDPNVAVELLQSWHRHLVNERYNGKNNRFQRQLTIEPWILMQESRHKRRKNHSAHDIPHSNETRWEARVYLNAYFFGSSEQHSNHFMPKVLPQLQRNWTSAPGAVVLLERLDHLQFTRKLGGVQSNVQLTSGKHGHDTNNQRWMGYSAVATCATMSSSTGFSSVFRTAVNGIFNLQPKCRRYAEFKPMGGAIADTSRSHGAFWHREALWMVLANHFYSDHGAHNEKHATKIEGDILSESQMQHDRILQFLQQSDCYGGMYPGYLQHTFRMNNDLMHYYGNHSKEIIRIKRYRDPSNAFRHWLPNASPSVSSESSKSSNSVGWDGVFRSNMHPH
jgi:FAD binding domain